LASAGFIDYLLSVDWRRLYNQIMEFVKGKKIKIKDDILLVDKPKGWTSHDVVAKVKAELGGKVKVGHGGSLDPFATGALLVLVGQATKRFEEIKGWDKEYVMEIEVGKATETGDSQGKVIKVVKPKQMDKEVVVKALNSFKGESEQQVPAFAAVKVKGKRLYQLARLGKEVPVVKRKVRIKEIELLGLLKKKMKVRVVCGSGTYMRQLAVDVGKKLGWPAHAKELRRIRVGGYRLEERL
jgi:tRNA pseudouridine55 synthase